MHRYLPIAAVLLLAGCATSEPPPPAPEQIRAPAGWLLRKPPPLPDIPAAEGDPEQRRLYYLKSRRMYGELADQVTGLQAWAAIVTTPAGR